MKTRVVTSVVGLGVLALVLCFFDTLVFNAALAAVALIALHEIYSAFFAEMPGSICRACAHYTAYFPVR